MITPEEFLAPGGRLAARLAGAGVPVHRIGLRSVAPDAAAIVRLVRLARGLGPAVLVACGRSALPAATAVSVAVPRTRVAALLALPPAAGLGRPASPRDQ